MGWPELTHPDDLGASRAMLARMLAGDEDRGHAEKRYLHADGHHVWAAIATRLVRDDDGAPLHFITQVQDVSAQKEAAEALAFQALHDPLTGLPNRTLFNDRLEQALTRGRRSGARVAVVFIDVDRFKVVNDSLGHESGDWLLQQIGARLTQAVRASDSVARFGGDEFVILFDGVADEQTAMKLTDRVRRELMRPFSLEGEEDFFATVSLGVAFSGATSGAAELVRDADAAMYRAKAAGGAQSELFDHAMRDAAVERLRTERALRQGLPRDELRLHYQPIFDLESRRIEAVEALVRWERPGHGLVAPGAFIGVAEECGLIPALGEWVLREACRQAAAWRAELGDAAPLPIHVNVSSRELEQPDLPGVVASALRDAGLDPADLVLEITESGLLERTAAPGGGAAGDQGDRRADRARRLRDRLLVAELPRALPDRRAQARPRVRRAAGRQRRRARDRRRDPRDGARARPRRRRRGHRDRGAGGRAARARVRARAGLRAGPPGRGEDDRGAGQPCSSGAIVSPASLSWLQ